MPHIMQFFKMIPMLMDRVWRQTIRIGVSAQNHLQRFLRELMPLCLPNHRFLLAAVHHHAEVTLNEAAHAGQPHRHSPCALQGQIRIGRHKQTAFRPFKQIRIIETFASRKIITLGKRSEIGVILREGRRLIGIDIA